MVPDELVAEARATATLDDFGGDSFREGLEVYCASVFSEAQLNEVGAIGIRGAAVLVAGDARLQTRSSRCCGHSVGI